MLSLQKIDAFFLDFVLLVSVSTMATLDRMLLAAENEMDQDQDEGKVRGLEGFRVFDIYTPQPSKEYEPGDDPGSIDFQSRHDADQVVRWQFLKALFRSLVMAIKASNGIPGQGRSTFSIIFARSIWLQRDLCDLCMSSEDVQVPGSDYSYHALFPEFTFKAIEAQGSVLDLINVRHRRPLVLGLNVERVQWPVPYPLQTSLTRTFVIGGRL